MPLLTELKPPFDKSTVRQAKKPEPVQVDTFAVNKAAVYRPVA